MNKTADAIRQQMKDKIAAMDTEQILACVKAIGGGHVDTDVRIVRAYLIEEIATRQGDAAADALMDRIGL